jgi:peptidoglycan/LPS O-acetylase OafA/YrhL
VTGRSQKIKLLNQLRGFAGIYVLVHHTFICRFVPKASILGFLLSFGQEVVTALFLLSGFVTYLSFNKCRDTEFYPYFMRRFRRIYPIFLLSLLVTYGVACDSAHTLVPINVDNLIGNLLMLQDFNTGKPGVWFTPFQGNLPLWSLSYQWWFYVMFFPIATRIPERYQRPFVLALSLVGFATYWAHPNRISLFLWYFIIWWTGAEMARAYAAGIPLTLKSQRPVILSLGLACVPQVMATAWWVCIAHHHPNFGLHPILELRHFIAALNVVVVALALRSGGRRFVEIASRPFGRVATISYGLYILHYPLCVKATYLDFIPSPLLVTVGYLVVAVCLAKFAEGAFQRQVDKLIPVSRTRQAPRPRLSIRDVIASLGRVNPASELTNK